MTSPALNEDGTPVQPIPQGQKDYDFFTWLEQLPDVPGQFDGDAASPRVPEGDFPVPSTLRLRKSRTFPTPKVAASALLGSAPTPERIDFLLSSGVGSDEIRQWADKMWSRHREQVLGRILRDSHLPAGVLRSAGDYDVVVGLRGRGDHWHWPERIDGTPEVLDRDEIVAFVDAIDAGAKGLILSAVIPKAFMGTEPVGVTAATLPESAKIFAVVDALDKDAVIDLYAIAAGGHLWRRHNGDWIEDPGIGNVLRSLKPPPTRVVPTEYIESVIAQVDESTKGKSFEPTDVTKALKGAGAALLPILGQLEDRVNEVAVMQALVAAIKGGPMPAKLQRYWLFEEGAAKIRWGTPGAWRRCFRQLSKYMGPHKAKGACTNLSKKLGGPGVATHVGS